MSEERDRFLAFSPMATTMCHVAMHEARKAGQPLGVGHLLDAIIEYRDELALSDVIGEHGGLQATRPHGEWSPPNNALAHAAQLALASGHEAIIPEHLLLGVIEENPSEASMVLVDPAAGGGSTPTTDPRSPAEP